MQYVPVDGEHELLPGLRLAAPGHTPGMQMVVVETPRESAARGGVSRFAVRPPSPAASLARDPELVWLTHEHEPWRPRTV